MNNHRLNHFISIRSSIRIRHWFSIERHLWLKIYNLIACKDCSKWSHWIFSSDTKSCQLRGNDFQARFIVQSTCVKMIVQSLIFVTHIHKIFFLQWQNRNDQWSFIFPSLGVNCIDISYTYTNRYHIEISENSWKHVQRNNRLS